MEKLKIDTPTPEFKVLLDALREAISTNKLLTSEIGQHLRTLKYYDEQLPEDNPLVLNGVIDEFWEEVNNLREINNHLTQHCNHLKTLI